MCAIPIIYTYYDHIVLLRFIIYSNSCLLTSYHKCSLEQIVWNLRRHCEPLLLLITAWILVAGRKKNKILITLSKMVANRVVLLDIGKKRIIEMQYLFSITNKLSEKTNTIEKKEINKIRKITPNGLISNMLRYMEGSTNLDSIWIICNVNLKLRSAQLLLS